MIDKESKVIWLAIEGYDYGDIASTANKNDSSFEEAIDYIFNKINTLEIDDK